MTPGPPPWRVFDSPIPETAPPADELGVADGIGPATGAGARKASAAARPTASRFAALRPDVLVGLSAALGGLLLAWLLTTGGAGGSISFAGGERLVSTGEPSGLTAAGAEVVVDVVGAVFRPGVYHLPSGSRVGDAIAAAGGFGPRVAADRVDRDLNLAAVLHDGDQLVVPSRDEPTMSPDHAGASPGAGGSGGRVDLNTATESELDSLPGIGPVTAGKIIASRAGQPFRLVDELLERKLVGQKTFDSIKSLVTVGE